MKFTTLFYKLIAIALIFGSTTSCEKKTEYVDDFFVGNQIISSGHIAHHDMSVPFPSFLEFKNDSLFLNNYKDKNRLKYEFDLRSSKKGDTFKFINTQFVLHENRNQAILKSVVKNNQYQEEFHFHKPIKTPKWSQDEVLKTLTKGAFTTNVSKTKSPNSDLEIKKTLRFTEDSLTIHYAYFYEYELLHQEQHTRSFSLTQKGNATFFTESEGPENLHTLYQISALGNDNFSLYYYDDQEEVMANYKLNTSTEDSKGHIYTTCYQSRPHEYYAGKFKHLKGNEYVRSQISKNAPKASGNGYITVHFIINCNNEIGMFGLEQMDRAYQPTTFEPALVKHIVQETLKLKDWPKKEYPRDIHAFLMFKIENGKITDLCP